MKKNTQHSQHTGSFHERPLVTAVRHALPYVVGLSLALSISQPASSRSSDSAAAFTATQLVRQFTLKNTVTQVSLGMQGYVAEVDGQQRGPAMGARPAGFPADMGSVPNTVNLPQRDGAGRPLGYCAWDNNSSVTTAGHNAGQGVGNPLVYAIVSPGLNGAIQTTCADILVNGVGLGDDHVQVTAPIQVSSKQYKTAVGTEADLLTTPGEEGDIRLVLDTNKLYSYVGGAWTGVQASPFSDNSAVNGTGAISYTGGTVTVADFQATTVAVTGAVSGASAVFTGDVAAATFTGNGAGLTDLNAANFSSGVISPEFGGTGVNGAAAANGTLLIGNGSGFTLGTLTAGAGISVLNDAGAITISNAGVLSITGTADQIIASANNGDVVLSLPQAIGVTSTPTFGGMMLNGDLMGTAATFTGAVNVGSLAAQRLDVSTSAGGVINPNMIVGTAAMAGAQTGSGRNTALGISALAANTSGNSNVAAGYEALAANTTGIRNTAIGTYAMDSNITGESNVAIGYSTLSAAPNSFYNIAIGHRTMNGGDVGDSNIAVGNQAMIFSRNGASRNIAIGLFSLYSGDGSDNAVVGYASMTDANLGYQNSGIGSSVLENTRDGYNNSAVGYRSLITNLDGFNNSALGANADVVSGNLNYATAIGAGSRVSTSNTVAIGRTTDFTVIGATGAASSGILQNKNLQVTGDVGISGNLAIGGNIAANSFNGTTATFSGAVLAGAGTAAAPAYSFIDSPDTGFYLPAGNELAASVGGTRSMFVGHTAVSMGIGASAANPLAPSTVAIGHSALAANGGAYNTAVGDGALRSNTTANQNTAIGSDALGSNLTGGLNVAVGAFAMESNTSGGANSAVGEHALRSNTSGTDNSVLGIYVMSNNTTGSSNTAMGAGAGSGNTTGSFNTILGSGADVLTGALEYATALGAGSRVSTSNTVALGRNSNLDQIVIGTDTRNDTTANTKLYVNGDTRLNGMLYGTTATFSGAVTMNSLAVQRLDVSTSAGGVTNPNMIVGTDAMPLAQSGSGRNTALGINALASNTSGNSNTASGYGALSANTTGSSNTASGYNALDANTTGQQNTALGTSALGANVSGWGNVALGRATLTGATDSFYNIAIGSLVMTSSTVGNYNIAMGWESMLFSGNGSTDNVSIGALNMYGGDGSSNSLVGNYAMVNADLAYQNSGIGTNVLTGTRNGYNNSAVGYSALSDNLDGFNNSALGANADVVSGNLSYATIIGADSRVASSNTIALGRNSNIDQVVIGTDTRNNTTANTKLYVNGDTRLNGMLYGTNATFSGAVAMNSLAVQRLDVSTSAGGVLYPNMIVGTGAMPLAQTGFGGNTALGISALAVNTGGNRNTATGYQALESNTTGGGNTAIGYGNLGANTTGFYNVAIGYSSLGATASNNNIAIGYRVMSNASVGDDNIAMGADTMLFSENGASRNVAIGPYSMYAGDGSDNAGVGYYALGDALLGYQNSGIGSNVLGNTENGYNNSAVGYSALAANVNGSNNSALGALADVVSNNLSYATTIGAGSRVATSNTIVLGRNSNVDQIVIGTDTRNNTTANTKLYVNGDTRLNGMLYGTNATFSGAVTMSSLAVQRLDVSSAGGVFLPNVIVGTGAMPLAQSGFGANTAAGIDALAANTSGYSNVASGFRSLYSNTTGGDNVASGYRALYYNTTGVENTAIGSEAMGRNTTGLLNVAVGSDALYRNTTGNYNVATGMAALFQNTTGSNNTASGLSAGDANTTGSNNTFLGYEADATSGALNYATAIGATSRVATSNTIALGRNSNVDQVVIGTDTRNNTTANTKLYVNGDTRLNGTLYGTTAVFTGAVSMGAFAVERLDVSTSAGGVTNPNMIVGTGAMAGAQSGIGGNTVLGIQALPVNTSGNYNSVVGYRALYSNTTGTRNAVLGSFALYNNTNGYSNTAIGNRAMYSNTTGHRSVAIGEEALYSNTTGEWNVAVGEHALYSNTTGYWNVGLGNRAIEGNTTGFANLALGMETMLGNTTGNRNIALGYLAFRFNSTGSDNVAIGQNALNGNTTGSFNTALGNDSNVTSGALSYATAIGASSRVATSNTIALGRNSNLDQVVIGTATRNDTTANTKLYVNGDTRLNGTLYGTTAVFTGAVSMGAFAVERLDIATSAGGVLNDNVIIGMGAMVGAQSGTGGNTAVGMGSLANNTSGFYNTATGNFSLFSNTTGYKNTVTGDGAMYFNTTGYYNTAMGDAALLFNTVGYENTALGTAALYNNTSGNRNTANGVNALSGNTTGSNNIAFGYNSGNANTTGSNNTFLGDSTNATSAALNYASAIGSGSIVATSNTIALGRNSNVDQVVIGTNTRNNTTANTKLYVNGITRLNGDLQGTTANFSGRLDAGSVYIGGTQVVNLTRANVNSVMTFAASNITLGTTTFSDLDEATRNVSLGVGGMPALRDGSDNTGVGYQTLALLRDGSGNTALGSRALDSIRDGNNNTAIGASADVTSDGLSYAAAIGAGSTVATSNTMVLGRNSNADQIVIGANTRNDTYANTKLYVNGISNFNGALYGTTANFSGAVTMGSLSLQRLDISTSAGGVGGPNLIVGAGAMAGAQSGDGGNTALGISALAANTTGNRNVAVGRSALAANTTGSANTASGMIAMSNNTTGFSNTALGDSVMFSNTTGYQNTAIGVSTLLANTTGINNTAIGAFSLDQNTVGYGNTVLGFSSLDNTTSGNRNVALGEYTGNTNTTGSDNTFLGSGANAVSGALSYATAIGAGSSIATSNTVVLGRTTDTTVIGATGTNGRGSKLQVTGTIEANLPADGTALALVRDVYAPGGYVDITGAGYPGYTNSAPATIRFLDDNTQSSHIAFRTKNTGNLNNADAERMRLTSGGNLLLASASDDGSGNRLQVTGNAGVTGNVVLRTSGTGSSHSSVIQFGADGNESTDPMFLGRINVSSNNSILQLTLGDDPGFAYGSFGDRFQIATTNGAVNHYFDSDGTAYHAGALNVPRINISTSAGGVSNPNIIVGTGAMPGAQTGSGGNTALGLSALAANTSGNLNMAAGAFALFNNTSGLENVASGGFAMFSNTSGFGNVALGHGAGQGNITGFRNTFIGSFAETGSGALTYATAIGASARVDTSNTMVLGRSDGNHQVVIGGNSRNDDSPGNKLYVQGNIISHANQVVTGSTINSQGAYLQWNRTGGSGATYLINQKGLGGGGISFGESTAGDAYAENMYLSSGGNLNVVGSMTATAFNVSSDRRLKTNINQLDTGNVLDRLEALRTYSYDYISNRDLGRRIGVIAQELQPLFPEAVAVRSDGFMAVDYNALGAMAAVGVGQLNSKFKVLDSRVTEQGTLIMALDEKVSGVDTRVASLETWKTDAVGRMDGFQMAIDSNVKKIAENALAIQSNTTDIKRLDDVLVQLDGTVKGNTDSINSINTRWGNTFSASEDGSLLTVIATELKVSNFTAQQMRSNSVYTQRLEAEMAAIRELEVDSLKANTAVANSVQAKMVNTGAAQVYAGVGAPAFLFSAPSDGHYTVNTSAMDGSYATATVIVNAGQAKVVPIASEGIELMAIGNTVKANAAGKSIKASWIKTG